MQRLQSPLLPRNLDAFVFAGRFPLLPRVAGVEKAHQEDFATTGWSEPRDRRKLTSLTSLASKVRIHTWTRSVPQRGSVGSYVSLSNLLGISYVRELTRRYRVTVLTVSNNDFRLLRQSLANAYVDTWESIRRGDSAHEPGATSPSPTAPESHLQSVYTTALRILSAQ